jgi:hypothetical protein
LSSFWFIIKQQWTIEEISIFSNSSHLEWRVELSDTILKWDYPRTIPATFGLTWFCGFRGKDLNVIFYQNMPNLHNLYKSGVIGRWSWFYLHIYAVKYVYFWILQRQLARHWGADVIHAGSRQGYLKKNSRIELCMVDKGFGGRQYQKTTLASNLKRD